MNKPAAGKTIELELLNDEEVNKKLFSRLMFHRLKGKSSISIKVHE